MSIQEVCGHILQIGDRVKMNIKGIGDRDLDGVEITADGTNYWRYMNQHPEEVYTVEDFDFSYEETQYVLSGAMSGNTWYADDLILVPEPSSIFEVIKNMTFDEMKEQLFAMVLGQCEDGVPSPELIETWLDSKPESSI